MRSFTRTSTVWLDVCIREFSEEDEDNDLALAAHLAEHGVAARSNDPAVLRRLLAEVCKGH